MQEKEQPNTAHTDLEEVAAQPVAQPAAQPNPPSTDAAELGSSDEAPVTEELDVSPSLQELLRIAELKAAEHHDAWLRAKAETENVRRRAQEDISKASKFAGEKFAAAMLPVKDSLEAALAVDNQSLEKLREGVELTLKQLIAAFEAQGLAEENPIDQRFDPNRHQAISAIEAESEPNTVINVLQKGYLLNERVIRPAMVVVSKAKSS